MLSTEEFQTFAKNYVLFGHVTTRIPDRKDDDLVITKANWGRTEFPDEEWIDCPGCGTNQHRSLDACRVCGNQLSGLTGEGPLGDVVYRCVDCGSRNVETVAPAVASPRAERR